jgi:hypothetical protein
MLSAIESGSDPADFRERSPIARAMPNASLFRCAQRGVPAEVLSHQLPRIRRHWAACPSPRSLASYPKGKASGGFRRGGIRLIAHAICNGRPLFAYGSLMFPAIIKSVIGRVPEVAPPSSRAIGVSSWPENFSPD